MMTRGERGEKGRSFSIELRSRHALKNASLDEGDRQGVLVEGTLGRFESASFLEGVVLEVVGTDGVLRVDLLADEILSKPIVKLPVEGVDRGRRVSATRP
jgi:hypothetical protein